MILRKCLPNALRLVLAQVGGDVDELTRADRGLLLDLMAHTDAAP